MKTDSLFYGIFKPPEDRPDLPLFFIEVQFQSWAQFKRVPDLVRVAVPCITEVPRRRVFA